MQNIKSKGTVPEKLVMKALRDKGIYFSVHVNSLTGKPDIVFRRHKIAVFIDSDFWHGRPGMFQMPKTNREYWEDKITRNRERDRVVTAELEQKGWRVLRYWEKDIKDDLSGIMESIVDELRCEHLVKGTK